MPEKLSTVLKQVDKKKLKDDVDWFGSVERLRQMWYGKDGKAGAKTIKTFYTKGTFKENAWEKAKGKFDTVMCEPEVQKFGELRPDEHSLFINKFNALNTLVKLYVIITYSKLGGKRTNFNPVICKKELEEAFKKAKESDVEKAVCDAIDDTSTPTGYRENLKSVLIQSIGTFTDNISKYLDKVYDDGARTILRMYDKTFGKLEDTSEHKVGLESSIGIDDDTQSESSADEAEYELLRAMNAQEILVRLAFLANEAHDLTKVDLCNELLDNIAHLPKK